MTQNEPVKFELYSRKMLDLASHSPQIQNYANTGTLNLGVFDIQQPLYTAGLKLRLDSNPRLSGHNAAHEFTSMVTRKYHGFLRKES
ncbi:hypothetical protein TNCV_678411 [Trichonephila clavipes]|nr:hypothetical protein TNCV_678411 [Trichonephila clavipes]